MVSEQNLCQAGKQRVPVPQSLPGLLAWLTGRSTLALEAIMIYNPDLTKD